MPEQWVTVSELKVASTQEMISSFVFSKRREEWDLSQQRKRVGLHWLSASVAASPHSPSGASREGSHRAPMPDHPSAPMSARRVDFTQPVAPRMRSARPPPQKQKEVAARCTVQRRGECVPRPKTQHRARVQFACEPVPPTPSPPPLRGCFIGGFRVSPSVAWQ